MGDEKYGNDEFNKAMKVHGAHRLFLHARDLRVRLTGATNYLELTCPLEPDLETVLENLRRG